MTAQQATTKHEAKKAKIEVRPTEKAPIQPVLQKVDYPRGSGIIMPIFSLPTRFGIGTMGRDAYAFVDFLVDAGQRYWQILPLGPTSYGDSPYQSFSSYAGNPYFIDLDDLSELGYFDIDDLENVNFGDNPAAVDYAILYNNRFAVLHRAFQAHPEIHEQEIKAFRKANADWIEDYALFMAIKKNQLDVNWTQWPDEYKLRDKKALKKFQEEHAALVDFQIFLQYHFYRQWTALRKYANDKGVFIIGDLPIYVAMDSADVWSSAKSFLLDEEMNNIAVAGAPPDAFTDEGQRWGNPLYDWESIAKDDWKFWIHRMGATLKLYDIIRLDHFIGFQNYWSVPAEEQTAKNGAWVDGPGIALFEALEKHFGALPILVEDLGVLSDAVVQLREKTGFPGMKPLQFAFGEEDGSGYLPHKHIQNSAVYTSTHDSDTLVGWMDQNDIITQERVRNYFALNEEEGYVWGILRGASASVADFCIYQMQDVLGLGNDTRMNMPGSLGGNWEWRIHNRYDGQGIAKKLRTLAKTYGRIE